MNELRYSMLICLGSGYIDNRNVTLLNSFIYSLYSKLKINTLGLVLILFLTVLLLKQWHTHTLEHGADTKQTN